MTEEDADRDQDPRLYLPSRPPGRATRHRRRRRSCRTSPHDTSNASKLGPWLPLVRHPQPPWLPEGVVPPSAALIVTTASSVLLAGFASFAIVAEATFRSSPPVARTCVRTVTVTIAPAPSVESVHWAGESVQAVTVPGGASA